MPRRPGIHDAGRTPAARTLRLARPAVLLGLAAMGLGATALAGCGSATLAELPPPAGPAAAPDARTTPAGALRPLPSTPVGPADPTRSTFRDGTLTASVQGRARTLRISDATTGKTLAEEPAGVGPTHVACAPQGPCFVIDTAGDGLLVFRVGAGGRTLQLTRRVYVDGAPFGIALDPERRRLWVTLTARNEVVELGAHGRPHILQRLPTVRQPDAVAVDPVSGDVSISGREPDSLQVIPDPASPNR